MYQTPPDGRASSGSVKCWNDMYIPLPRCKEDPENDPDVALCRRIAADSTDATAHSKNILGAHNKPPLVKVIDTPPPRSHPSVWKKQVSIVKENLSKGFVTILRDTEERGPAYAFDAESAECLSHRKPDGARIQWQSPPAHQADTDGAQTAQTIKGTVTEFFEASSNKQDRVNCLDLAIHNSHVPYFIAQLASDMQALSITDPVGFGVAAEQSPEIANATPVPKPSRKRRGKKSNADNSDHPKKVKRAKTSHAEVGKEDDPEKVKQAETSHTQVGAEDDPGDPSTRKFRSIEEKLKRVLDLCDSLGIQFIEWDSTKTSAWALLTSSCCLTSTHQDAAGYFTWVKCETGVKLWCYLVPKDTPSDIADAMKHLTTVLEDSEDTDTIDNHAELVSIVLTPGTVLIQPAGSIHMVYTLADSVFTGGHFYLLDGMHLVEATRACAAFTKQSVTNASHPGCLQSLCRIVLSLLFNNKEKVLRKPFISLAHMILWSEIYSIGDADPEGPSVPPNNESKLELKAARACIEAVLEYNDIDPEDIRPKDLKEFEWLARGEAGEDWKDPGTATITIPDYRRLFRAFHDTKLAQSTTGNAKGNA